MYTIFYTLGLISAILVILCTNPVNSVLFLISVFLCVAMLFLLMNAEFLALVLIIVYVGAIAVLFLFIVMMINIKRIEKDNTTYLTVGLAILVVFFIQFYTIFFNYYFENNYSIESDTDYIFGVENLTDESLRQLLVLRFGVVLFFFRPTLLLFTGIILLVSMLGAIYLTNEKRGFSMKRQLNQFSRNPTLINVVVY